MLYKFLGKKGAFYQICLEPINIKLNYRCKEGTVEEGSFSCSRVEKKPSEIPDTTVIDTNIQDTAAKAALTIKEKYGDETSCGDVASAVFDAIKDSGHDIKIIDEGGHVYVADYTSRQIIDYSKETTDRLGDEIIEFDDARDFGYRVPDNVEGARYLEVHGKKIISH